MTGEPDRVDASASRDSSSRDAQPEPRTWVRFALIAGAIPGGAIGLFAGWSASKGTFYILTAYVGAAVVALLVVVLVIGAAVARNPGPALAALALAATSVVGYVVAPGAPGSTQRASGTGTAGTRADPAALWSGSVSCEWPKDEATSIDQVRGFDVPITDAAFLAAEQDVRDVRVTSVLLDPHFAAPLNGGVTPNGGVVYEATRDEKGWIGFETSGSTPQATVFEKTESWQFGADLEGVSADGRTGTAVLTRAGDIVLKWRCSGGP